MKAVILAAGMGRRLGHGLPKCLTALSGTMSILDLQLAHLHRFTQDILLVVGYKKELVLSRYRDCASRTNERYATTNTAHSLTLALEGIEPQDVLWLNGDVVFSALVLERLLRDRRTALATRRCAVGDEEVKYFADAGGRITAVSKQLQCASGEAVGVNFVRGADLELLLRGLRQCGPEDYFEKGVEHAMAQGLEVHEVNVSDLACMEVDFPDDLAAAKELLPRCLPAPATSERLGAPSV